MGDFGASNVYIFPMRKKLRQWEVYRLKGSPAAFMGLVYAPNEKSALKTAIKQLKISNPEHQKRPLVRRA
jgi:hypothetical protein